jgi:hypothetical protein
MGSWNLIEQEVYDDTPSASYADLDLSSVVGSNRAVVLLSVIQQDNFVGTVYFKPKDEIYSTDSESIYTGDHGIQSCYTRTNYIQTVMLATDEDGIIQLKRGSASSTNQCKINIEGYFIPSVDPGMIDSSFAMTTLYPEVDVSALVGSNHSLAIVRHRHPIGGATGHYLIGARPTGRSNEYRGYYVNKSGGQCGITATDAIVECVYAVTDADGVYELGTDVNQPQELYLYAAEVDKWVWVDQQLHTGSMTRNVWIEFDTGSGKGGLAFLEISYTGDGTGYSRLFGRRKGDTRDTEWKRWDYTGVHGFTHDLVGYTGIIAIPMDDAGILELYSNTQYTGRAEWDVQLLGYVSGEKYEIDSVVHSYLNLRVNFSKPTKNDVELNNPDNYQITVTDPTTAFDFGAVSVTPEENVTYPTYVDLEMTDCTHGKGYTLVITADKLTSEDDDLMTAGNNEEAFTGVSELPEVLHVIPLSLTQVKVVFTKYMVQSSELMNIANYVWTGGIQTLKVEQDTNSSVIVTVTTMEAATIYDLTVG